MPQEGLTSSELNKKVIFINKDVQFTPLLSAFPSKLVNTEDFYKIVFNVTTEYSSSKMGLIFFFNTVFSYSL